MANAVNEVFDFIVAQGLSGGGWAILRRRVMDGTGVGDKLIVVSEDGGSVELGAPAGSMGDAALADKGVMVQVRATAHDGDASFLKANAILVALHGLRGVTLVSGGGVYLGIRALTPEPVFAGYDERGRPLHTVAFRLLTDATNL